jgi:hypothetical protein
MDRNKKYSHHDKKPYSRDIKTEDRGRGHDRDRDSDRTNRGKTKEIKKEYEYGLQKPEKKKENEEVVPKEQPSLALSGNLAKGKP